MDEINGIKNCSGLNTVWYGIYKILDTFGLINIDRDKKKDSTKD
jgi:hypothetical protein